MFLFILDSDENEIMAIPAHKKKYEKKQGSYHCNNIFENSYHFFEPYTCIILFE